jgi:signal transduction histidine kinase
LEATLKALPDMHFEVDADDKIVWFHSSAIVNPYVPEDAFLGKSPGEVLPQEVAVALHAAACEADATGKGVARYMLDMPEGRRHFETYVTIKPGDRPTHIYAVRDVTEGVALTEAVRLANKRVSLLGHITRHDLVNSISVASGYVNLCLDEPLSPKAKERLERVDKSLREMRGLIDFTKEYQDMGKADPVWNDVTRLARREGVKLEASGIELKIDGRAEVLADKMFAKVLYNLLDNVSKHAPSATECNIICRETADKLEIIIQDNGDGIPEQYRERLFHRGQGSNTGLGLYLSKEILATEDITIDEESKPGEGARFVLRIPQDRYRIKEAQHAEQ